ncbi:hypothetical protein MHYP_G00351830, partial [Metynnis hypsauchen]
LTERRKRSGPGAKPAEPNERNPKASSEPLVKDKNRHEDLGDTVPHTCARAAVVFKRRLRVLTSFSLRTFFFVISSKAAKSWQKCSASTTRANSSGARISLGYLSAAFSDGPSRKTWLKLESAVRRGGR